MTNKYVVTFALMLFPACGGESSDADGSGGGVIGGAGGNGGGGGGVAGGESTTTRVGACVCDSVCSEVDPVNFETWCGANGPGVHPAVNCENCLPSECVLQPVSGGTCVGQFWCCVTDFNPPVLPHDFLCSGSVACDDGKAVDLFACAYDEIVQATSDVEAKLTLLQKCRAAHPGEACGLWTLECEEVTP